MATKATIKNIFDNFGDVVGILTKGQSSDDLQPTLSGTLSKGLKREFEVVITNNEINKLVDQKLETIAKEANLPGLGQEKYLLQLLKIGLGNKFLEKLLENQ